jgi:hypothetical protein
MKPMKKTDLVVLMLSASWLGLALPACEGVDAEAPAGAPAPAAVEETFDVTTIFRSPDGQLRRTSVQMTESQWQKEVVEPFNNRRAGNQGPAVSRGDGEVFETKQATILADCGSSVVAWIYSGYYTGSRVCLAGSWDDTGYPNQTVDVGFVIRSYVTHNSGRTLICTGTGDCMLRNPPCYYGNSVWVDAPQWSSGTVATPPPFSTARYVHVWVSSVLGSCP